jgi:uncharacterized repeat protein (TIGR03803 family)
MSLVLMALREEKLPMRSRNFSVRLAAVAIVAIAVFGTAKNTVAQTAKALHSFAKGTDGASPNGGMVFDNLGNLYGTTHFGGTYGYGTVFELLPSKNGGWSEKLLHSFINNSQDGLEPDAALIFDSKGNLYGTTSGGGAYGNNFKTNGGTVFELSPTSGGVWTEKVLHSFQENGKDGYSLITALTLDAAGDLIGTTAEGGTAYGGTVFKLSPASGGTWTERILLNVNGKNGTGPATGVISDSAGNLYGTTAIGGSGSGCQITRCGTVFELSLQPGGMWTEKVLYNFNNTTTDGQSPNSLIFDTNGNLYGTTYYGGTYGHGTIFELSPSVGGGWTEKLILSLDGSGTGDTPVGLILDSAGNLYGETYTNVLELTPAAGGWTEKVLYTFAKNTSYGSSGVILDSSSNLYGETWAGGAYNLGTVFEVTP